MLYKLSLSIVIIKREVFCTILIYVPIFSRKQTRISRLSFVVSAILNPPNSGSQDWLAELRETTLRGGGGGGKEALEGQY